MSRIGILRTQIMRNMIELAELNERPVIEEVRDMYESLALVLDEILLPERDQSVVWD